MQKSSFIIQTTTSNTLLASGLPAHLQGFNFAKDAVILSIKKPNSLQHLTKELYPEIGKKYGVSGSIVERSIRSSIDYAYDSESLYGLNDLLNIQFFTGKNKPSNGYYIALIAEIVKNKILDIITNNTSEGQNSRTQALDFIQEEMANFIAENA